MTNEESLVKYPGVGPGEVWVDALCVCGDTTSHDGTYCPQRLHPSRTISIESSTIDLINTSEDVVDEESN